MKKNTNSHYNDMVQVYRKMHDEVHQLAKQVLELNNLKHKLGWKIKREVKYDSASYYCIITKSLNWMLQLNNDKKFLEACFMWLYGHLEDEEMYEVWHEYLDEKEVLNAHFHYFSKLCSNHILPL